MPPAASEFAGVLNAHTLRGCQLFATISATDLEAMVAEEPLFILFTSGTEGAPKALLGLPCELIHQPGAAAAP